MFSLKNYLLIYSCFLVLDINAVPPSTVIGQIPDLTSAIQQPSAIAITTDGLTAYICDTGNNSISVVDVLTNTIIDTIPNIALNPDDSTLYAIVLNSSNSKAYVTTYGGDSVRVVDLSTKVVTSVVDTGYPFDTPIFLARNLSGSKIYVTNLGGDSVSIINTSTDTVTGYVLNTSPSSFSAPEPVQFTPDGTKAYVGSYLSSSIVVIDAATNTISTVINDVAFPRSIAFTPDGTKAYVTNNSAEGSVAIIDVATDTLSGLVTDLSPATFVYTDTVAILASGTTAYVSSPGTDEHGVISVIDVATNSVIGVVSGFSSEATGNKFYPMAFTPNSRRGYVLDYGSNLVDILAWAPGTITAKAKQNVFLTQTDLINQITWTPAVDLVALASYSLYRDASLIQLIATVPATQLSYDDHNRQPNRLYNYYLIATDIDDVNSASISTSVVS